MFLNDSAFATNSRSESPPNLRWASDARTRATMVSTITPSAGTAVTSVRSLKLTVSSLVTVSTVFRVGRVRAVAERSGVAVDSFLSNSESEIVSAVQGARAAHGAIIINAGALTHYSWALHDALRAFDGPKIEVHISNPGARESFRHTSVIAPVVNGTIAGFGGLGYDVAAHTAVALLG